MVQHERKVVEVHWSRRQALAALAGTVLTARGAESGPYDGGQRATLEVAGSRLTLHFLGDFDAALRAEALAWVRRSADAVTAYYARFPVPQVALQLTATDGSGVGGGRTFSDQGLHIHVRLGRRTTHAQFLDDWVLVHEMVHLSIPQVTRVHNWLQEGIAVYVEGVARGQAGLQAPASVWQEWKRDMPKGQPRAGDAGLDHTPTWGRTYWGGAMFCLLADVRMRRRSSLKVGLRQALQGVLAVGGSYAVAWPIERILSTADAAVGQDTLMALYQHMKDSSAPVDLDGLWRQLGVEDGRLDDAAPLASVRRAILS